MRRLPESNEVQLPRREFLQSVPVAIAAYALTTQQLLAEEPDAAPEFLRGQGSTTACGTTCVQMLRAKYGDTVSREDIDKEIRRMDTWTHPSHILQHLKKHGYRAQLSSNTESDALMNTLDNGIPVIVLVDSIDSTNKNAQKNGGDWNLHYQLVYDYDVAAKDGKRTPTHVVLCDPGGGGSCIKMPYDTFVRSWSDLRLGSINTGVNKVMISAVPNKEQEITGKDNKKRNAERIMLCGDGEWGNQWFRKAADFVSAGNLPAKKQ